MHWTSGTQQQGSNEVSLEQLPVMPQLLLKLLLACQNPATTYEELAALVRHDPVIYVRILAIANSRNSLNSCPTDKLDNALAALGINTLRTIAITTAASFFFSTPDKQRLDAHKKYWSRALRCAITARVLAQTLDYENPEEAYTAGLLHNLGHIIFCTRQPADYTETYLSNLSEQEFQLFESEWVGEVSENVAAELLQNTVSDSFLSDAILLQHKASDELQDTPLLIKILNFACKLIANDFATSPLTSDQFNVFSLSSADIKHIQQQTDQAMESLISQLEISPANEASPPGNEVIISKLGDQIKNFTTLFALNQGQPQKGQKFSSWQNLLQNLNILFGLDITLAFEYQKESNSLRGASALSGPNPKLKKLIFHVENGRSMLAEALIEGHHLDSDTYSKHKNSSTADQQLIRFLNSEAIICLPLVSRDFRFGVLVAGLSHQKLHDISSRKSELEQFIVESTNQILQQELDSLHFQQALEIQKSDYMEGIRRLAHEAANPLGIINNYVQVICRNQDGDSKVSAQLHLIREEIERVAKIVEQMKEVDTSVNISTGLININQLIREQINVFRDALFAPSQISCELDLDDRITFVKISSQSLRQILTNLLKNAAEAMPDGGRVTLRTRSSVNFNGKLHIELVVADTGSGITPEVLEWAFSPSNNTEREDRTIDHPLISRLNASNEQQSENDSNLCLLNNSNFDNNTLNKAALSSTKGNKHSGLGLSITSSLVASLKGYISCRNRNEGGAEFTILLPDLH